MNVLDYSNLKDFVIRQQESTYARTAVYLCCDVKRRHSVVLGYYSVVDGDMLALIRFVEHVCKLLEFVAGGLSSRWSSYFLYWQQIRHVFLNNGVSLSRLSLSLDIYIYWYTKTH
jgi:hypothetical protein